jgi:small subunit ribosomal protein S8e
MIDATPFRQWYTKQYNTGMGTKKSVSEADQKLIANKKSGAVTRKMAARNSTIDPLVNAQASTGRLMARISSRPGQSGRCDGYILEGKELEFYQRAVKK